MSIDDAITILAALYSAEDPIELNGVEIMANELDWRCPNADPRKLSIRFHGKSGPVDGTVFDMIVDRMDIPCVKRRKRKRLRRAKA